MAVDFRCEKCGKLLSMDAEPGSTVRCPHCRKKLHVPEALASLPRPQVPGGQPASAGGGQEGEEVYEDEHQNDAVMMMMANMMPWVMSIFFHLGLALIMMFFVMIAAKEEIKNRVVPETILSSDMSEKMQVQERTRTRDKKKVVKDRTYTKRPTAIKAKAGTTKKAVALTGTKGFAGAGDVKFGGPPSRAGNPNFYGPSGGGRKPAYHIVYVIDRSGSMVPRFDEVCMNLGNSIANLKPIQDFHIIFFGEGKTIESPPRRLVSANDDNKTDVAMFLDPNNVKIRPDGMTTVLPALKRAFKVLENADTSNGKTGKLIYLLTDGDFAGMGGGSKYKGLAGNEAVVRWLKDNNKAGKIHINTLLFGDKDDKTADAILARKVMDQIAKENGGEPKLISVDE